MLLASSDNQGRGLAEYDAIKWYVCPNVPEIGVDDVAVLLGEMEQQGMITVYGTPRGLVYQIIRWWEYQDLQWARPSKYDPPDGWTDRLRYSNRGAYFSENWDTTGGFDATDEKEPTPEEPVNQVENHLENKVVNQPNLTQPNSTQLNSTNNIPPSSGEKPETKNEPDLADELFGHVQESEPKAEGPTYLEQLREAAGGDPVAGAFIAQTATDTPMSVPAEAGGQDD